MQRVFAASVYSNAAHSDIVDALRAPLNAGSVHFPLGRNVSKIMAAPARFAAWEPLFWAARTIKLSTCQHAVLMSAGRSHLRQIIAYAIICRPLAKLALEQGFPSAFGFGAAGHSPPLNDRAWAHFRRWGGSSLAAPPIRSFSRLGGRKARKLRQDAPRLCVLLCLAPPVCCYQYQDYL